MLGDGSLVYRGSSTAHFSETHCEAQRPYLEWKASIWGAWACPIRRIKPNNHYRMWTHAHPDLLPWHRMFYPEGKGPKCLPQEALDLVDDFALAVWYMDDGSAGWWPMIAFGMPEPSRTHALAIFRRFGFDPEWKPHQGDTGYWIFKGRDQARRFLDLVSPHVPDPMRHKVERVGFLQARKPSLVSVERIREGLQAGVPVSWIAATLGVGQTTVRRKMKEHGLSAAPSESSESDWVRLGWKRPEPTLSDALREDAELCLRFARLGIPSKDIAWATGLPKHRVDRCLQRVGFRRKTGPKRTLSARAAEALLRDFDRSDGDEGAVVERVYQVLCRVPFPFPEEPTEAEVLKAFDQVQRATLTVDGEGIIRPIHRAGTSVCGAFFPNRYKVRVGGKRSAWEGWFYETTLKAAIRFQVQSGDPVIPSRVLRALQANCRTPTVFRPTVVKFLCERFLPEGGTVWDPCAGYGGRLMGTLAAGCRYVGLDADPETVEGNRRLGTLLPGDAQVTQGTAEDTLPPSGVSLVLTSPPYFRKERYLGRDQSWRRYSTYEAWVEGFLRPMLQRSSEALIPGGILALNVADVREGTTTYPLVDTCRGLLQGLSLVETLRLPLSPLNRKGISEPILVYRKV